MKIYIDINHPAHVHYFRNFIKQMEEKGHQFCVVNRDSLIINQLLDYYSIKHTVRNKRPIKSGNIVALIYLLKIITTCIYKSIGFRPDMYIGFASAPCSIVSWLFHKPCILLEDTEHNELNHRIYSPFVSAVLTPFYFGKNLNIRNKRRGKQIIFNAFVEQLYLHSAQYKKNDKILYELGLKPQEYVLVRYIAYNAHHDLNVHPLSDAVKKKLVQELSKHYKVLVSLEEKTDDEFYSQYAVNFSPEKMHDIEANAKFMITEGGTMASESFIHGVPYICINPLNSGNLEWQCSNYPDRSFKTTDEKEIFDIIKRLIASDNNAEKNKNEIEKITINPTEYLKWIVENYPNSLNTESYEFRT